MASMDSQSQALERDIIKKASGPPLLIMIRQARDKPEGISTNQDSM